MQEIEDIYDQINEELEDAEKYIHCAIDKKTERPSLAETYYTLSLEEMKHVKALHDQVVTIIEEYKKEKGPPPERMMGRYEYAHKQCMKHASDIKAMQVVYKDKG